MANQLETAVICSFNFIESITKTKELKSDEPFFFLNIFSDFLHSMYIFKFKRNTNKICKQGVVSTSEVLSQNAV